MNNLFNEIEKGAEISDCGKYRYRLWRIWDRSKPMVMFLMLNPSTADASVDDPTIRRCIGFSKSWGYGGLIVCNLFAYRATDPKELLTIADPIGYDNVQQIILSSSSIDKIVCAWGNGKLIDRVIKGRLWQTPLKSLLKGQLYYLAISKDNTPKHPLYLKSELKPRPFIFDEDGIRHAAGVCISADEELNNPRPQLQLGF